jgi:DNA mismatch endonuclease (patch repair protein)
MTRISTASLERLLRQGAPPSALRSRTMAAVGQKNTSPELLVRKALHRTGLRFRLHTNNLPCLPDIVLPSRKLAIFVHGCFWHQHEHCKFARKPKSRLEFWNEKFARNRQRDVRDIRSTWECGWTPVVVWECETKRVGRLAEIVTETLTYGSVTSLD